MDDKQMLMGLFACAVAVWVMRTRILHAMQSLNIKALFYRSAPATVSAVYRRGHQQYDIDVSFDGQRRTVKYKGGSDELPWQQGAKVTLYYNPGNSGDAFIAGNSTSRYSGNSKRSVFDIADRVSPSGNNERVSNMNTNMEINTSTSTTYHSHDEIPADIQRLIQQAIGTPGSSGFTQGNTRVVVNHHQQAISPDDVQRIVQQAFASQAGQGSSFVSTGNDLADLIEAPNAGFMILSVTPRFERKENSYDVHGQVYGSEFDGMKITTEKTIPPALLAHIKVGNAVPCFIEKSGSGYSVSFHFQSVSVQHFPEIVSVSKS